MVDKCQLRVIVYDIADDRRRRKVASVLVDQAVRVQESVFEARLTNRQVEALLLSLRTLISTDDSVRVYVVADAVLKDCRNEGGPAISDGGRFWLM